MPELDPTEHTIQELGPKIQGIDDVEELRAILEAEQEGEDRTGAKTVIESRIEKLEEEDEEMEGLPDLTDMSTAEAANAIRDIDDPDDLQELLDIEEAGEDRGGVKTQIQNRLDSVTEDEDAEEGEEEEAETPEERHPHLDHPTADKRHVRAVEDGTYRDMWVYCETQQGELIDVSKEMLGKARQLMDDYNDDYGGSASDASGTSEDSSSGADEKVIAVVIGDNAETQAELAIEYGADVALYQEDDRLSRFLDKPYTEIFCDMARGAGHPYGREDRPEAEWHGYDEPRYVLFPATNNGRDLSATVQAELDSGLASDCSDLFIENVLISNPAKTGEPGTKKEFERVLHMKRPDFSGFEYSTILCLDKPDREFHPQGGSVIPGTFDVPDPDPEREGEVVEWEMPLDDDWFTVEVTDHDQLDEGVDLTGHEVVVAMGRGIGDDPTTGIELGLELTDAFEDAALGLSRGVITASYQFEGHVEDYITEERQIGESGQVVEPPIYIAAGISGAVQHKVGMDEADTIISVNTDTDADIVDFSDYFIEGDLFDVLPAMTEALESGELDIGAVAEAGGATDD
jgi:electron transfer flavoprotein alpha subunit